MDRPAAALRHAVQAQRLQIDGDIAHDLQLLRIDVEDRFRSGEALAPHLTVRVETVDRRPVGRHADGVGGGISRHG